MGSSERAVALQRFTEGGDLQVEIMGGDLFHLVPKDTWEEHKATQSPYYPSTYEQVPLATPFSIGAVIDVEGLKFYR